MRSVDMGTSFALHCISGPARLVLLCPFLLTLGAQTYTPGPQVLTYLSAVDDSDQPYAIYIPKNFDPARKYPLVVSLHGAYSNHRLNLRRVFGKGNAPGETDAEASRRFPPLADVEFLVVSPLARGTIGYQGLGERDVYDVLDEVKRRFPVDEDRVYLTGLSMGGGGALWLALTRPDVWAAVAAVCPATPPRTEELAGNAKHLPVHLFQGAMDPTVPASSTRAWHKRLFDLGAQVEYVEYRAVRHNSWDRAYAGAAIFEWFAQFKRDPFPPRVVFSTRRYAHRRSYWVEIDGLEPGRLARVDARFESPNNFVVETHDVDGFTLHPAGHASYRAKEPVRVTIDATVLKLARSAALSFRKGPRGWEPGRYAPAASEKKPGAEGPILAAVSGRHLYVYGTLDLPSGEETARRREQADRAANWSLGRATPLLNSRVIADRDVTEADLRGSDAVLFGTRHTNRLVARWADRLPLELNPGAADYGLLQVAHIGDRLVLVSSGLPWWESRDVDARSQARYLPLQIRLLNSFEDYIVFRGSIENVVAEGYFDRNWKLPPEQAEKLRATRAVSLH